MSTTLHSELGIRSTPFQHSYADNAPGSPIARRHVDDVRATVARLLAAGATEREPIIGREEEFVTASVVDPFGNVLGPIQIPHYLEHDV